MPISPLQIKKKTSQTLPFRAKICRITYMEKAEISGYGLYDIRDLIATWKRSWRELANLGYSLCPQELKNSADKTKTALERMLLVFEDALCPFVGIGKYLDVPKSCPDYYEILNLAASSNRKPYSPVVKTYYVGPEIIGLFWTSKGIPRERVGGKLGEWSENKRDLKKALLRAAKAFAASKTYGEALSKIASSKNRKRFTDFWSHLDESKVGDLLSASSNERNRRAATGEYLSCAIDGRLSGIMEWLGRGLTSKAACEEAWWNCLWLFIQPTVENMLDIEQRISERVPLHREQIETLDYYISHGYPTIDIAAVNERGYKIQIVLKPHTPKMILNSPFEVMAVILLVQPAFALAQLLQRALSKPRFISQCRAPSCAKLFYTGWKNATACPGKGQLPKSSCALEWVRYRRWLLKTGRDPERDWDDEQLKKEFISYNKT